MELEKNWNEMLNQDSSTKNEINPINFFTKFCYKILRFIIKNYFEIKVKGIENIGEHNAIFAPNHISYIDGFCLASALPEEILYNTYFLAKEKHLTGRIKQYFVKRSNLISTSGELKEKLKLLAYLLKSKKNIVIFPEGTRSLVLRSFKKSFAILSKETNTLIVPVVIKASQNIKENKFLKRGKIEIEFLKPISPTNKTYDEILELTYEAIKEKL